MQGTRGSVSWREIGQPYLTELRSLFDPAILRLGVRTVWTVLRHWLGREARHNDDVLLAYYVTGFALLMY